MNKSILKWNFVYQYGYTITNMINAFVLLPFYVKYIPNDILGIWWATGNILAWLTMTDPGVGDVIQQKIASNYVNSNWKEIGKLKGAGIVCGALVALITLIVGGCIFPFIETILKQPFFKFNELIIAFLLTIATTAFSFFSFVLVGINQGLTSSKTVAISYVSGNVLYFISNISLLVFWNTGVLSIAYSNMIRVIWIIAFNIIFKKACSQFGKTVYDWKFTLSFSKIFLHTATSRIVGAFANNLDLILISRFLPSSFITLFEINRRPVKMLQGLIGRSSVALMPFLSLASANSDQIVFNRNVQKQFDKYLTFSTIIIGGLIVFGPYLIELWVGKLKFIGTEVWVILCISSLFWLIGYFLSNILFATGDIKGNSNLTIVRSICYVLATWLGLKFNGFNGLVIAQLINTLIIDFSLFAYRAVCMGYIKFKYILLRVFSSFSLLFFLGLIALARYVYWTEYKLDYLFILVLLFCCVTTIWLFLSRKIVINK